MRRSVMALVRNYYREKDGSSELILLEALNESWNNYMKNPVVLLNYKTVIGRVFDSFLLPTRPTARLMEELCVNIDLDNTSEADIFWNHTAFHKGRPLLGLDLGFIPFDFTVFPGRTAGTHDTVYRKIDLLSLSYNPSSKLTARVDFTGRISRWTSI